MKLKTSVLQSLHVTLAQSAAQKGTVIMNQGRLVTAEAMEKVEHAASGYEWA